MKIKKNSKRGKLRKRRKKKKERKKEWEDVVSCLPTCLIMGEIAHSSTNAPQLPSTSTTSLALQVDLNNFFGIFLSSLMIPHDPLFNGPTIYVFVMSPSSSKHHAPFWLHDYQIQRECPCWLRVAMSRRSLHV